MIQTSEGNDVNRKSDVACRVGVESAFLSLPLRGIRRMMVRYEKTILTAQPFVTLPLAVLFVAWAFCVSISDLPRREDP